MNKAVVTGSAGFIGGHLTQALLDKGWKVVGIDNMSSGLKSTMEEHLSNSNFRPIYLDISDSNHFFRIRSTILEFRPEYFFHLAAVPGVAQSVRDPILSNTANVTGLLNMLSLASLSCAKRFIFSSSSSVYGGLSEFPTNEESPLRPKSPYALQKKFGEEYCRLFSEEYNLDTVSLRYFNVFGPRQRADSAYSAAIPAFCNCVKQGLQPVIYGSGEQTRDFCFVDNVVSANILAATAKDSLSGEAFNIGCGGRVSINDVCSSLGLLNPLYREERPGDVSHSQADISKAFGAFGYKPLVSYEEGLKATLRWTLEAD